MLVDIRDGFPELPVCFCFRCLAAQRLLVQVRVGQVSQTRWQLPTVTSCREFACFSPTAAFNDELPFAYGEAAACQRKRHESQAGTAEHPHREHGTARR